MQEYSIGKPVEEARIVGETDVTGTYVTFKPDETIFQTTVYKYEILAARLRELSFLNAGIRLTITDERQVNEEENLSPKHFFKRRLKGIC